MRTVGYIASGVIVGSSLVIASSAIAGGFAIREQSTTGLGLAFADSAAGSDLSSMYWNPAAVTAVDGMNSLSSFTAILPNVEMTPTAGTIIGSTGIGGTQGTNSVGTTMDSLALLSGSYFNYQLSPQMYVGMSINAPFGTATETNDKNWAGAHYNRKSEILTINAAPTIGYKVSPMLSVAVGVQVQYIKARLEISNPTQAQATAGSIVQKGEDVAVGFTAGLLLEPMSGTKIGVGYRSALNHKLDGEQFGHFVSSRNGDITADVKLPDMVTISLRQQLTSNLAVMANYEWANWSRLQELTFIAKDDGANVGGEDFKWEDSWFVSAGAELDVSETMTVRAGVGYEVTPVPDTTRSARLPDSDRVWLSFGGSYKWSDAMTLDFGYSHIFFEDSKIAKSELKGDLNADVANSADIISIGMRHKW